MNQEKLDANMTSKQLKIQQCVDWLANKNGELDYFAITVVFRSGHQSTDPFRWEPDYKRVLRKINKKLSRHCNDLRSCMNNPLFKLTDRSWAMQEKLNVIVREKMRIKSNKEYQSLAKDILHYHEYDQTSKFRVSTNGGVNHIHGIVGIPKNRVGKIWDQKENILNQKLTKDLKTMDMISSVKLEPIRQGDMAVWMTYISKMKAFETI